MSNVSRDADSTDGGFATFKIRKRWLELSVYIVLSAVTIIYLKEAIGLPSAARGVGAGGFPVLISTLIGVSLFLLILMSLFSKRQDETEEFIYITRPMSVILAMAVLLMAVMLLPRVGPIIGITLISLALMWLGGERRHKFLLMLPPLLSFGIYVVFVLILGVYFD